MDGETPALIYLFPVTAGPQSFPMESSITGGNNWNTGSGMLTALFVPFGGDGRAALDVP